MPLELLIVLVLVLEGVVFLVEVVGGFAAEEELEGVGDALGLIDAEESGELVAVDHAGIEDVGKVVEFHPGEPVGVGGVLDDDGRVVSYHGWFNRWGGRFVQRGSVG